MAQAKTGDKVRINYTGKLADGSIIDTTLERPQDETEECTSDDCGCDEVGPVELTLGAEEFIIPIEEALVGMQVGEQKSIVIPAEDAFGEYDPEQVFAVGRDQFPADIDPQVGMGLEVTGEDDEVYMVTVVEVSDDSVSLDTNHPLAGEDLTYEFELVEIL